MRLDHFFPEGQGGCDETRVAMSGVSFAESVRKNRN